MRSTGEVMGIDSDLGAAFFKAYNAAGMKLPKHGKVLITVKPSDKRHIVTEARLLQSMGYELVATEGTWKRDSRRTAFACERVNKVDEGRPHIVDLIKNREIALVLNTPHGMKERMDDTQIRASATDASIACVTTLAGIRAVVSALGALQRGEFNVCSLKEYHARATADAEPVTA